MTTIEIPERIATLPRDQKGRPVPYFVRWVEGKPDFRIADPMKMARAYYTRVCFICGQALETYLAFVIGPMNAIGRISAEPPNHLECAKYAAQVCPFLVQPKLQRRTRDMPEDIEAPPGLFLEGNPGVTAIWVTEGFKLFRPKNGLLAHRLLVYLDEPTQVLWYKEARLATRDEVAEACIEGAKRFYAATGEEIGPTKEFERNIEKAKRYWPEH